MVRTRQWARVSRPLQQIVNRWQPLRGWLLRSCPYTTASQCGLAELCTLDSTLYGADYCCGAIHEIDLRTLHTRRVFVADLAPGNGINGLAVSPDRGELYVLDTQSNVLVYTLRGEHVRTVRLLAPSLAINVCGPELLACNQMGGFTAYRLDDFEVRRAIATAPQFNTWCVRLGRMSPWGHQLLCTTSECIFVFAPDSDGFSLVQPTAAPKHEPVYTRIIWDMAMVSPHELVVVFAHGLLQTIRVADNRVLRTFGTRIWDVVFRIRLGVTVLPNGHILLGHDTLHEYM